MADRLYIVPQIGVGTRADPRRPKYIDALNKQWSVMDYGFQPIFFLTADLTDPQHASMIANADVTAFPDNRSVTIGGGQALQNARDALEAALIPGNWVGASDTWDFVAHTVASMFQFMQRLNFYLGNIILLDDSTKLNIQWSSIPAEPYQKAILDTAQFFGYSTAFIAANTQMRAILKNFADQWGSKPVLFGPLTL